MKVKKIIVHCSDTPNFKYFDDIDIDSWHKARGFNEIGYHKVILLDGRIKDGRALNQVGAHCLGHNHDSIGICMIGRDKFTDNQWESLVKLISVLQVKFPEAKVYGHYEFSSKTCPNFNVERFCKQYNL